MHGRKNKPRIFFHFPYLSFSFKNRTACKVFIEYLFKKEKTSLGKLDYIFCSDEFLLEINKQSLNHDFYTDILTFRLSNPGEPVSGEVYISIDRVKDNSVTYKTSFIMELHRVIFHGALHLCGYGDKTKKEKEEMRHKENESIEKFL